MEQQSRLLLGKQFLYPGEELEYTYINNLQGDENLLYVGLIDIQKHELIDFVFHTTEDKVIEGGIVLDKTLKPGYYLAISFKAGDPELHFEQFWVRDIPWQGMGGRIGLKVNDDEKIALSGRFTNLQVKGEVVLSQDTTLLSKKDLIIDNEGQFELNWDRDEFSSWNYDEPVWAFFEMYDENEDLAFHRFPIYWPSKNTEQKEEIKERGNWLTNTEDELKVHVPLTGAFQIVVMGAIFFKNDQLTALDTLTFQKSEMPTGRLDVLYLPEGANNYLWEEIWNFPKAPESRKNLSLRSGESVTLSIPQLPHPWVRNSTHYLSVKMGDINRSMPEAYRGIVNLGDTLDRTLDVVLLTSEGKKNPPKNRTVLFTNGEYLIELKTNEEGVISISRNEIGILGYDQGRVRFREEHSKVKLETSYPAIEWINSLLPKIIGNLNLHLLESEAGGNWQESEIEVDYMDDWVIDLEEVVVGAKSYEDKIQEVLEDPFSLDWLNEDWINNAGVLSGTLSDSEGPYVGNTLSAEVRVPLHIIYTVEKQRSFRKWFEWEGELYEMPTIKRNIKERFPPIYTWDPNWYLDQIGTVKLPRENRLKESKENVVIRSGQKEWAKMYDGKTMELRAPVIPGSYQVEISYWDLFHNLSTTISYDLEVKN